MTTIADKMVALHEALAAAAIPHAFGGALALAWCVGQARGTVDVDVNLFVPPEAAPEALAALPGAVAWDDDDLARIRHDGQVRLWWDQNPVDLFFNTTEFHEEVAARARWEPFRDRHLPFLACADLAVFKVFFDRTKDWADLEAMAEVGALDVEAVLGVVVRYFGHTDERVERLRRLA